MPLEDLDLEFEDEEDLKRKRHNEMVHQDVDIEFGASPIAAPKAASTPAAPKIVPEKTQIIPTIGKATATPTPRTRTDITPAPSPQGQVKRLDEARAALKKPASIAPQQTTAARPSAVSPMTNGSSALDLDLDSDFEQAGLAQLTADLEATKFDAKVQIAVAEFKTEILSDVLSDVKLLDHQVHQLLVRINQKHPDLKPEVMALKKLLADFAAKKRK